VADLDSSFPPLSGDFMPCPEGLDVRGIAFAHRAADSKLPTMLIEPSPHHVAGVGAIAAREIGGTAVTISTGCYAPAVE
jgi:hypothetical protein